MKYINRILYKILFLYVFDAADCSQQVRHAWIIAAQSMRKFMGLKAELDIGISGISQSVIIKDAPLGDEGSIINYVEITECFSRSYPIGGNFNGM